MTFITSLALRRPTVTVMAALLLLASGIFAYRTLQIELFPQLEFPLVTVFAVYPSADPEAVVRDVTEPIEKAISGIPGLEEVRSSSFEGNASLFATFKYGTDMAQTESAIEAAINNISFPEGVPPPTVGRINPDEFPIIQFSVISDRPLPELQSIVRYSILPEVSGIDGIMTVALTGEVERSVRIVVDAEKMAETNVSLFQIAGALSENNVTLPAGVVFDGTQGVIAKTTHTFNSVQDLENLIVGGSETIGAVRLSDVADVTYGEAAPDSISRTNGRRGISVAVSKLADANTIDVTTAVKEALDSIDGLPPDVEIITVADQGPQIQDQIDALVREALFGFLFAVSVVFAFMLTIRPTILRGLFTTLRPTMVIALSIPLSVFTGILLMSWQDMTLNFMTLGGLAISVGRVVDDSIVVLENVYRHIQGGRERWRAAMEATREVGPAIFASTMTTVVVFVPLGFISGIVGSFFLPFALTVTFALIASLLVALTVVPVLGAYLLRPGDLPEGAGDEGELPIQENWMQRGYLTILRWALGHKLITLGVAAALTVAGMAMLAVVPITLFGAGSERFLNITLSMPAGTTLDETLAAVEEVEQTVAGFSDVYTVGIGNINPAFATPGGFDRAVFSVNLSEDAPEDVTETLRAELDKPDRSVSIQEVGAGPPQGGVEIAVTGPNYDDIAAVTDELMAAMTGMEGITNLTSTVAEARDEISVQVDPERAAFLGLTTRQVGFQLSLYLIGQTVTTMNIDGETVDVTVSGDPEAVGGVERMAALAIVGPRGAAPLGQLAELVVREGPVSISRTDGVRSATITADIIAEDAQGVGFEVDRKIAAISLPPGVNVSSGGLFADIQEVIQAIGISMGIGIVLVYLVMVISLGSLRNPFVIVTTLPLALIGVFTALAVTGRPLSMSAMMGILLLVGIVVTNAIVLIAFVEQQRERGMSVYDALISGARVRLRPILMTATTTSFALLPLAVATSGGGLISAGLATVVIGGLVSSTGLTLLVLPIVYLLFNESIPNLLARLFRRGPQPAGDPAPAND